MSRSCSRLLCNMSCLIIVLLSSVVLLLLSSSGSATAIFYNTSAGPVPNKLNVHLVPHSHDDVGWLKTVDQYYVGSNNSLQEVCVELILDTVISNLQDDPNRKFIFVEQAFFQRWWRRQSEAKQAIVKHLVDAGQLEFINGGWCMHDEAVAHYIDMIDQTTLGHRFIKQQFGISPRIGWQIDPFGHSAVQAYLLGAELGFDALYFARIDYQDKLSRENETSLEMVWEGSNSFGSSTQIFTGVFQSGYWPPTGFEFENDADTIPIQDDPLLFDYNVKDRVDTFVSTAQTQANYYRTNHIMFTMGSDFTYQNARSWYREMDKLIHHVNLDGRVNTFYSTPSIYTDAKYAANKAWPLKTGDFFPYADNMHAYWTGYFTSRSALKGYVRMLSNYYLAARQLEFIVGKKNSGPNTDALGDALGIVQHHDAITGTEKQHVADDYAKRLFIGAKESSSLINSALTCLTSLNPNCEASTEIFEQCPLLNISYCPPSESNLASGKTLVVLAYNPLGWNRTEFVRIPVNIRSVVVKDADGKIVPAQLVPISNVTERIRKFYVQANLGISPGSNPLAWLVFKAFVLPLGFSSYFVSSTSTASTPESFIEIPKGNGTVTAGSGNLKLTFSIATGQLTHMTNHHTGVGIPIQQSYLWYSANTGDDGQASGAYIFRPNGMIATSISKEVPLTIFRGHLVDEVHQQFSPWVSQVTRLYKEREHVECEFMVGPIPIDDGIGKEVITRMTTGISSNETFYTDANGRDFLKRVRNYRSDWTLQVYEPISCNYYPINLGAYITDRKTEFSVLTDRSLGCSSIADGQLELMLHRRLIHDDGRGVAEALNESACVGRQCEGLTVQGTYFMSVNVENEGSRWRRSFGQRIYSPLQLAFAVQEAGESWQSTHTHTFSALVPGYSLPDNVAMITLQELDDGHVLLRLAHLFEVDEDGGQFSVLASVDLKNLFARRKIANATEVSLSANQEKKSMKAPMQWQIEGGGGGGRGAVARGAALDPAKLVVELGPMEIRTFLLSFS